MLPLVLLIAVGVLALTIAAIAFISDRQRRTVLDRAVATGGTAWTPLEGRSIVLAPQGEGGTGILGVLGRFAPKSWSEDEKVQGKLVQAGYDSPTAPVTYAAIRLTSLVLIPTLAYFVAPRTSFFKLILSVGFAILFAFIVPMALLDRQVRKRQERVRRSLPDALDLMVVCVEAGVSLDAAVLRVARELQLVHEELSYEFLIVNRKTNAGVPRDEALKGLWLRTGVEDLRALVASMIQSEKWGTSISTVLRVNAETLRRKRRQYAEKKAAMAPLKMTIPLVTLILPALFIVILGPTVLKIGQVFSK